MNEISINPPIFTECLWFNNFICIDNKSIFFSEWYKNGIMFFKDIINNDGSFLTLDEFYEKFKFKPSFLQYNSLLSSIPNNWKKHVKDKTHPPHSEGNIMHSLSVQGKLIPLSELKCKDAYWILINSCKEITLCIQKWSEIFEVEIPVSDYKKIFNLPFQCCTQTNAQSLQLKILHRIIVHNKSLFNMKLIPSPNCNTDNCNEIDTIHHRYFQCKSIQIFWKDLIYWWQQHIENVNHLTMQDVIFGIYKVKNVPLNYCILLGKCFIHLIHSKSPGKQIEFIAFKNFLRNKLHAKENYLCSKNQMLIFYELWQPILVNL